jgi:hypothetical protein
MNILRLWALGIFRPANMAARLNNAKGPSFGLCAVLVRFVSTSATSILALYLAGRLPFAPSELILLPTEKYYFAEMFFLPAWGLAIWLLMASMAYLALRFRGAESNYDKILNIVGMGMLVPMPFLWIWDWTAIALNIYTVTNQAVSHSIAQAWETTVQAICYVKVLKVSVSMAIFLAILTNAIYILLAMHFIR